MLCKCFLKKHVNTCIQCLNNEVSYVSLCEMSKENVCIIIGEYKAYPTLLYGSHVIIS